MIEIKRATSLDASDIIDFTKICGSETDNLSFDGDGISITVEQEMAYLNSIEKSTSNIFLIARDGNEIVGTGNYYVFPKKRMSHRGEFGISVKKSHWNQGIGSMLLKEIIVFAKKYAKSEIISLEVRSDNNAAIHLYEKFGFINIGTFKGYFKINGELVDFDIMQLIL